MLETPDPIGDQEPTSEWMLDWGLGASERIEAPLPLGLGAPERLPDQSGRSDCRKSPEKVMLTPRRTSGDIG
jgi:hypothetical protein